MQQSDLLRRVAVALGHHPDDDIAAIAATRAVFEHLRDNALPHATRVVLNEAFQECAEDDAPSAGERIFLAGVKKLLEGLPRG